jgi:hypothetical protein
MLCFDAWLNQDTFWRIEGTAAAIDSAQFFIKVLRRMCSNYLPTTNSNRWNFPKFHKLLHVVDDMSRFGAPNNICAQRPDSLLISAAKQPGRHANSLVLHDEIPRPVFQSLRSFHHRCQVL